MSGHPQKQECQTCGAWLQPVRISGKDRLRCPWTAKGRQTVSAGRIYCIQARVPRVEGGVNAR